MAERYKVLLVEDNQVDRMSFERFVRTENLPYDYTIASSVAEAKKVLTSKPFDVALMDYQLGDGTSLELFEAAQHIPIIVLTGSSDLKTAVKIMKLGAYDFLTKDSEGNYLTALPVVLKNTIERWRAQQELTQYRNHLEELVEERTAAFLEEHNLLRTLIDNIPDYIFVKDREGRFVESNRAHTSGANTSREEIIGRTATEVFDPAVADQFHADDLYVMTSGKAITNEERLTTGADGSKRWVLTTKVPLFDESKNNIIGLVGISRDITDRRKAEEARLQAERLHIEIEQERELLEMKQRFIATASHDFRTPLTVIKIISGTLEEYHDRLTPEKRVEKLKQIQLQVDRMVSLLDDVLRLSKASAGKVEFSPSQIDLKAFCNNIWEDMVRIDQDRHQQHFEYAANVQKITADEQLLQQILVNLLSNAFKYTPQAGDIQFQVTDDEQFVTFRVSDNGYGIPEADQKHLFEPFYRATNVKDIQGTGLGLAIVKAYVDRHDGTIAVQSKEGTGTTFTIQLPLHP